MKTISDGDDEAGEPAQTGSLIHLGIQIYHNTKESKSAAMVSLQKGKEELFPLANLERATEHVNNYIARERNDPRGKIIHVEQSVTITIPPAAIDKTKKEIVINGTIDQIRLLGDWFYIMDFKTGWKSGEDMVRDYTPQIAAYMIAGSELVKSKNVKSFINRTEDLKSSRYPYWWEMPFNIDKAHKIMRTVANRVALIRNAELCHTPGKHCDYCLSQYFFPGCIDNTGQMRVPKMPSSGQQTARKPLKTVAELFK